ncbi:NAD(P)-binding protein [Heliocybe sulcata]|uniref:NAD(P)-binding protein n=1 Tax=Heliocybe sulcata TaxID=5364 RepID=A0A5C3N0B9_9AGAM|nr:NAD(P)-binding protein [Heliocybe sulcata]
MVANAGITVTKPILETSGEEGTFFCYKYAAEQMVKQGRGGRIVGASSIAGKQGTAEAAVYAASKFAIRGLTQSAALEWGKHGITVNAYAPGITITPFLEVWDTYHTSKTGAAKGSWIESQRAMTATGTFGSPEEIGALVSYLVSDAAKFVTGQTILIDGGTVFD